MASLICSLKGHRPGESIIRNQGHAFARCARCGVDLVEVDGEWRTPPKGAKIVWKSAGDAPSDMAPTRSRRAPAPPAAPDSESLAESEPDEVDQPENADRRERTDRRKEKAPLPAFLRGQDRRSGQRDRRRSFGRRFTGE